MCLEDRKILLTRPGGVPEGLKKKIIAAGGSALYLPSMEIRPVADGPAARDKLAEAVRSDILVFVSRNAVSYACKLLPDMAERSRGRVILAVGSGTGQELKQAGFDQPACAGGNSGSEALLDMDSLREANVRGRHVSIVRGEGGRALLGETLTARGASVAYADIYRRTKPEIDPDTISRIWGGEQPDAVVLTSGDGMNNLLAMTGGEDRRRFLATALVVISRRLEGLARATGFSAAIRVAMGYSDEDILQALKELFRTKTDE